MPSRLHASSGEQGSETPPPIRAHTAPNHRNVSLQEGEKNILKRISEASNRANWRPGPRRRGHESSSGVDELGESPAVDGGIWRASFFGGKGSSQQRSRGGEQRWRGKSRKGGERERERWGGMCEWGDDRWGPVAVAGVALSKYSTSTATKLHGAPPAGYTTIGTEQREVSVGG
jgi:hypothetical protein